MGALLPQYPFYVFPYGFEAVVGHVADGEMRKPLGQPFPNCQARAFSNSTRFN